MKHKKSKGNSKINILLVSRGLFIGGAELVIANLCRHLDKKLFDIGVCYLEFNGPVGKELSTNGFDVFGLPKNNFMNIRYLSSFKFMEIVKQKKIDIIHSHDTASLVDSSLCRIILSGIKLVHTFHFGNYPHLPKNNYIYEKVCWRVPDKLIAVGNEQRSTIQKTFKIPDKRIMTVWNGIDKKKADIDADILNRFTTLNKVIIGSLSTLIEQKGITYLLDVAYYLKKRSNSFIFIVVGDGPLRAELESKCTKLGLQDTVYFLGWVENAASRILPIFDIFFQPSLWEAMSMVLLEAMAEGKPVVVTNVGESKYVVNDGEEGFLVEPKDIDSMAMTLEKLILQPNLRKMLGLSARKRMEQYFTAEGMARGYEKVYLEFLGK